MSSQDIGVFSHGFGQASSIHAFLGFHLPASLPIYHRVQHRQRSPEADLLATFPADKDKFPKPGDDFTVLFIDPATPKAIEGFIFSSLQLDVTALPRQDDKLSDSQPPSTEDTNAANADSTKAKGLQHVLAALTRAKEQWTSLDPSNRTEQPVIKIVATHQAIASALRSLSLPLDPTSTQRPLTIVRDDTYGPGGPFCKYLFTTGPDSAFLEEESIKLPPSLEYSRLEEEDCLRIVNTNPYVDVAALLSMTSSCIRDSSTLKPAAWAFRGLDGGIRTVHCEPEWRRKGLARAAVTSLLRQSRDYWHASALSESASPPSSSIVEVGSKLSSQDADPNTEKWEHVDIKAENAASIKLFECFGAKHAWDSYWMHVDLDRLEEYVALHDI